ncbi:protein FAR1-RELATED SEQUENCE 3 isoform X2 [Jatropha curcas]|uniref:protein FAR1-RELATED SEQUENCE 3 isoform X2 n=1 Tax=Jatropha curcas TaxID=180498 RepID=UPI0005FBFEFD|nr:protein FAR1-RELATED SEQUENCE 3 isoform X2 [Jatropha curcas]
MDVHVIDEEEGMGHRVMAYDGDAEPIEGGEVNNAEHSSAHDEDVVPEPYVGMEFHSEDVVKTFYDEYARRLGFSSKVVHFNRTKTDGINVREFACGREGLKRRSADSCDAMLRVELKGQNKWVVTKFIKEHSHSMVSPSKVHYLRPRRHFAGATKGIAETYQGGGIVPSGVMSVSMDGNHAPAEANRGLRNSPAAEANRVSKNAFPLNYTVRPNFRKRTLGRDAQNLLEYFKKMQAENPGFFYAIQLDEDNRMANVFWADARSRTAYNHFGDAVTLDTNYRVNQYRVPFAPFTGVNHHGQTILFGCAILLDDSEASFVWLFKTFLTAMNDRQPVSIITDQDMAIQLAVSQVFPESRHCISKWHVLREGQEKLAHVCHAHPNFQVELYNCINLTETIEEFDSSWSSILDKYDLSGHDWLQLLYNARAQWVPVYFRDSFFAAISPNQGFDGSFFDGYVNQQTTLPLFFRQYERALENCFERELEADFDTICTTPVLRTPSPMEKQAASMYTRKIFAKFQEELVETFVYTANKIEGDGNISTFRVAKFEDDHKAYIVTLNYPEMKANCSCQMFEYSGILCRHVLTVFTVTNVLTLPSHYILKRWTRNAKTGVGVDERGGELHGQESLALRYNNLCREAIKYAEEGAIAVDTYNVAMSALREGVKRIAAAKKNVAKVPPPSSQAGGIGYDDRKSSTSASDTTPLLWPRQDEVTRRFNLNDAGAPAQSVADLNLPRMAPVSLQRDEGAPGNIAVLPCLKSMTWVMENKNSTSGNRVAVINLKLQDYNKNPSTELEVKFQLSRVTLEPMLRSMAYISEQLSTPANRVAVINLKLQDTETTSGESDVKFQVSRDTLGAMLRSMAYIREQLSNAEPQPEPLSKKPRK